VHTEYSMLDGAARLPDLFRRTAEMGMPALAMTDHGNMFGAYDFYAKAKAAWQAFQNKYRSTAGVDIDGSLATLKTTLQGIFDEAPTP